MTEPNCLLDGEHQVWHADSLNPEHVARVMGGHKADLLCVDALDDGGGLLFPVSPRLSRRDRASSAAAISAHRCARAAAARAREPLS